MPVKKKKKPAPKKKIIRKKPVKRIVKKKAVKRKPAKKQPAKKKVISKKPVIGKITHYFPKVRAAVIKLQASLATGDTIKVKGHTTDFTQTITSMQVDHVAVSEAKKGQEIGLLVDSRVRQHDIVYKA